MKIYHPYVLGRDMLSFVSEKGKYGEQQSKEPGTKRIPHIFFNRFLTRSERTRQKLSWRQIYKGVGKN